MMHMRLVSKELVKRQLLCTNKLWEQLNLISTVINELKEMVNYTNNILEINIKFIKFIKIYHNLVIKL
jgi:hypothetical protein